MFKIRIFIVFIFISAIFFAQKITIEKGSPIKIDSVRVNLVFPPSNNVTITKLLDIKKTSNLFFIPNAKPKDDSLYAALKGKKRDDSIYNMPNTFGKKLELAKK